LLLFRCVGQLKLTMVAMARHVAVVVGMTMFASARANDTADYSKFMAPGASTKLVRGGRPKDFGFLKEAGLEKPSWLPDFGGDKAAEEPKAEEKKSKPSWLPDFGGADEKPKEEKQAAKKWFFDNSNPLGLSALSVALLSLAGLLGVRMRRGVQSAADLAMPMAQASVDNILELKAQQSSVSAHRKQNLRPLTALYATADSEEATAVNDEAAGEQATNDEPAPVAPPPVAKWSIEKDMPAGISGPFGLFDPAGFSDNSPQRLKYFREAELKHGRVAMLAAFGFPIAEHFHPLFGGNIDVPSYIAFQQTPLQTFWPLTVLYIGIVEIFSVFTFQSPFEGNWWTLKEDRIPGDYQWDPMDMYPALPKERLEMQTKELNNGRLAMIAIAGMVAQELATGNKLF